jgi:pimeloyl-ACP methyl ester carboxylesterase
MQQRTLTSFDGTRIVYQLWGADAPDAERRRWLVIANGYGGTFCSWHEMLELLASRHRVLIWDYRGLHASAIPTDRARLRIDDQCRDLELLLAAEDIPRAVLIGWSVGVQVALERYRVAPDSVEGLVLHNGAHGRVLHRSLDGALAAALLRPGVVALRAGAPALAPLLLPPLRAFARRPLALGVARSLGLVHGSPSSFNQALQAVLAIDYDVYCQMALLADEHDCDDMLTSVRVPTLVTAGERDIITRPRLAKHIASRIPGAIYFEIPGGTHYSVMEFPRLLANRIESFISGQLD